jgi:hypothetical protein
MSATIPSGEAATPEQPKTSVVPQVITSTLILSIYAGAHYAAWKLDLKEVLTGLLTTDSALAMTVANYWLGSSFGSDKKTASMLTAVNKQVPPTPPHS